MKLVVSRVWIIQMFSNEFQSRPDFNVCVGRCQCCRCSGTWQGHVRSNTCSFLCSFLPHNGFFHPSLFSPRQITNKVVKHEPQGHWPHHENIPLMVIRVWNGPGQFYWIIYTARKRNIAVIPSVLSDTHFICGFIPFIPPMSCLFHQMSN